MRSSLAQERGAEMSLSAHAIKTETMFWSPGSKVRCLQHRGMDRRSSWLVQRARTIAGTEADEHAFLMSFDSAWVPRLQPMFQEIGRRLELDFFGVDCNIDAAGRVLLFEANACMKILGYTGPKPNIWEAPIARITAAVEERLSQPAAWRRSQAVRATAPPRNDS